MREKTPKLVKETPINIESGHLWIIRRIYDLLEAMEKRSKAKLLIPVKWINELTEHIADLETQEEEEE